ncbi:hypothetical protein F5B19DRAFT_501758 [Rostrohypoxylon terebratum]|nr:hypothetical protein F5B19DRAFT_501758 [Rostrohypoxylon terebratum]
MKLFSSIFGVVTLIGSALATTKIPGNWFHDVPMFHFGRPHGYKPCYPESAQINGQQVNGNDPDNGDWSPKEGGPLQGNPFPVYYTINQCKAHEFREGVTVVWKGDSNNNWERTHLMFGQHGGYDVKEWKDIQNTFNGKSDQSSNGAQNRDYAKVFVGAFYHAIFNTRKTSIDTADPADKQAEFRSNDWFIWPWDSLVQPGSLINSNWVWGKADTNPPTLSDPSKGAYICNHNTNI